MPPAECEAAVAVVAGRAGHIVEYRAVIGIDIADRDRAGGRDRCIADVALGDCTGDRAGDYRAVIRAGYRNSNLLDAAIRCRIGDGVIDDVTRIQILHRGLVQGVDPGATSQLKAAVAIVSDRAGHIIEDRAIVGIRITDCDRAGGRDRCIADIALGDCTGDRAGDYGIVIRTGDADCDLLRAAVGGRIGDRVIDHITGIQILYRGLVQRIGPGAGAECEAAVGVVTDGACNIIESRAVVGIDIRDRDAARRRDRCVTDIALGHRTRSRTGDDRIVIGTRDRDSDLLGTAVSGGIGDGVGDQVTGIEILHRTLVEGVGPGAASQVETAVAVVAHGAGHIAERPAYHCCPCH